MTGFPDPAGGFDDADGRPAGLGGDPPGAGGANAPEGAEDPAGPGAAGAAVGYGGQEHLERLDRLGRFGRLGFEGAEGPADGADPLERVLRPAPGYLAPPPGAFERVRGRAARRRRLRAAAGVGTVTAVAAVTLYAAGTLAPGGDGHAVAPPASSRVSSLPAPASTPPSAPASTPSGAPEPPPSRPPPPPVRGPPPGHADPLAAAEDLPQRLAVAIGRDTDVRGRAAERGLGDGDAGAGQLYRYLVLTNTSGTSCHVDGYPGVSLLDADGRQIGQPADRDPRAYSPVVLAPGAAASDTIHTANRMGTCLPASVKVRVYPPGSRQALTADGQVTVCAGTFTVTPLAAGTTGNPPS